MKIKIVSGLMLVALLAFIFSLSEPLFDAPTSTIVYSSNGDLIGARVADDGQWRFEAVNTIPDKLRKATIAFEDKRFYYHRGIDQFRLAAAVVQNIRNRRFVSGASTISMQVIRLAGDKKKRNLVNKTQEMILATRLELSYSKSSILHMYVANAPYGGNVVGFEAASWRYFGIPPDQISWAQAAMLAVLPNSPGLIHPGSKRELLEKKRNRLLEKMYSLKIIDDIELQLSLSEEIPPEPHPLPTMAPHITERLHRLKKGRQIHTYIDKNLQEKTSNIVSFHHGINQNNEIHNCAVIVIRNEDGAVLSYIGNTHDPENRNNNFVDMVMAGRSGGSILKPLLYLSAFEEGLISPRQLMPDIPVNIDGFAPENFDRRYNGAVPASEALSQSLNIPAVTLLRDYGISKMLVRMRDFGLTTVTRDADHYGLPLILGSPDIRLWEIAGVFSSLARILNHYNQNNGKYCKYDVRPPELTADREYTKKKVQLIDYAPVIGAGPIYQLFEILTEVRRPDEEGDWQEFLSSKKIAWKTGTSYGLKDAWSIGVTKNYTVGVWVGNSKGTGRPGLVGTKVAGPILFDIFSLLPDDKWFEIPHDDLIEAEVCRESGYLLSENCETADTILVAAGANDLQVCPFHIRVLTDNSGKYLVHDECRNDQPAKLSSIFVLPPAQEYFYRIKNPSYEGLPSEYIPCKQQQSKSRKSMEFIYPNRFTKVIIPRDFDGNKGRVIFRLVHADRKSRVFWHINDEFISATTEFHNIEVLVEPGIYALLAVDDKGNQISTKFEVIY